jgi:hypothetical protein
MATPRDFYNGLPVKANKSEQLVCRANRNRIGELHNVTPMLFGRDMIAQRKSPRKSGNQAVSALLQSAA